MAPPPSPREAERLALLGRLDVLDTVEEPAYDDLTAIAAHICGTPIALVSLLDETRQWFKSHHGLDVREAPRELAFCAHAIAQDELFEVEDSLQDHRFADNPLVTGAPLVRFYAGAPLVLAPGLRLGTLCVIDHQRRKLSPAQRQALEALARQVVAQLRLRLQVQEWRRLDEAKDQLLQMVSHDMRSPLSAVLGSLAMLERGGFTPEQVGQLVGAARRSAERLLRLVSDLLDHARLRAGQVPLAREPLGPRALLRAAQEAEAPGAALRDIRVEVAALTGLPAVHADPERIAQVFANLISNACKFAPRGSAIRLDARREGGELRFSVADEGPGVPAADRERVFERFERLGADAFGGTQGSGVGLAICRQLVELHGGRIGCAGAAGGGAEFWFTLPVAAG